MLNSSLSFLLVHTKISTGRPAGRRSQLVTSNKPYTFVCYSHLCYASKQCNYHETHHDSKTVRYTQTEGTAGQLGSPVYHVLVCWGYKHSGCLRRPTRLNSNVCLAAFIPAVEQHNPLQLVICKVFLWIVFTIHALIEVGFPRYRFHFFILLRPPFLRQ